MRENNFLNVYFSFIKKIKIIKCNQFESEMVFGYNFLSFFPPKNKNKQINK